ncbi:tetratricopeptide repeat protein [Leptolyngbya sp. CCNP1308]|uniref:tetratricopeptide repeat protein n=1 Tax=Leptolyngbya sp. CCNP1308 TaxID=3110255 RepID=UPI002B2115F7|nr:tetratricopeptide repeat protein [Leptolyngbya sp. CCNP1308]MEA5447709.1 tetratricopeptide repeat protein [Leptolyngbya sp. CCNP1308]
MGLYLTPWLRRQQARYCYRQALTQIRKGNIEAAIAVLPQALDHAPHPANIHIELGKAHWQIGNTAAALEQFTAAIALDPANVRAYGNRGLLHCQQGQDDLALSDWQQGLQHQPGHALIHYNRGLLHFRQQNYAAALADFDAAIATNPNLAEAYLHRGHAHEQLGQSAAAAHDWELALCNDLNLAQARLKLHQLQQVDRDRALSQRLQAELGLRQISVEVEHQDDRLRIQIHRPVGVGLNYFTLPEQIRALLIGWQMDDIYSFDLTGQVQDQSVVEWRGHYKVFQGQPCPPTRWHRVLLTAFVIFPPLGIPALAYAMNLRQAYQQGDYLSALRASRAIHGLCRAGGIISLTLATMVVGYWGYQRFYGPPEASAAPAELAKPPVPAEADD